MTTSEHEEHAKALELLPDDERRHIILAGVDNFDEDGHERRSAEKDQWQNPKRQ